MTPEAYRTAYTAALEEAGSHGPGWNRALRQALKRHGLAIVRRPRASDAYPNGLSAQAPEPWDRFVAWLMPSFVVWREE
jgi:hypothetical protein